MWERIPDPTAIPSTDLSSSRLRVPGGWLVRTIVSRADAVHVALIFVSDPANLWKM